MDEYVYLWAQWGILRKNEYEALIKVYGDLKNGFEKITSEFLFNVGFGKDKVDRAMKDREALCFHNITRRLEDTNTRILYLKDADYPALLKEIADPPVFLFVRGTLPPFHKSISVVGTRGITPYGRAATEKFVTGLVQNGFVVTSGMALGVDACAHEITLKNGGITVAVLGSGADELYPIENARLGQQILEEGGAVVSEYPLGTPAAKHHFPERNRIIAGLTRGTLVIEGGVHSGALITARLALDYNREVFAVPHGIDRTELSGTNDFIKNSKAHLVERVEDILENFKMPVLTQAIRLDLDGEERGFLDRLTTGGKTIDELAMETLWPISRLSQMAVSLQLKGALREEGQKWVLA